MLHINISAYNKLGPDVFKKCFNIPHNFLIYYCYVTNITISEVPKHTI